MPGRNGLCVLSFGRHVFQTDLAILICLWHPTSASAGGSTAAASAATFALRHHTCDQLAYSCRGSFRGPRTWRQLAAAAWAWAQHASTQARKHAGTQRVQCEATPALNTPSTHSHVHVPTTNMHTNPLARGVAQCDHTTAASAVWVPPPHNARPLHGRSRQHIRPLANAKNIQETNTRLHVQARQIGAGAVAARAHRRCLCAYRRQSNVGGARECVSVKITVRKNVFFVFPIFSGTIFSKRLSVKVREVRSTQGCFGWQVP